MNWSYIQYLIGRLLMVLSLLMLPSLLVAVIYQNEVKVILAFVISMIITFIVGKVMSFRQPEKDVFFAREGFVLVSLSWFLISMFGALPFYLSGAVTSYVDALFEAVSGFTTTGASVLVDTLDVLPESLMFWRSFTLLVGGMGMLIFLLYIVPNMGAKGVYVMRAELPGPTTGKLESRVSSSIYILYFIYLFLTVVFAVLLWVAGVPWFESMLLSMGTAGTGGFNIYPASIAHYDSRMVETILMIAMFTFGLNFNFFYLAYERRWKEIFKDEELKWYIYIILGALAIISLALIPYYDNFFRMIHDVLFNIVSIMSTTAYTTVDILEWPIAAHTTILLLMFVGAMSGSTASGLKVIRIGIYLRSIKQEIQHLLAPNRVIPMTYNGKRIEKNVHYGIVYYLMTYLAVFVLILVVLSFDAQNFSSAFSATIATISNIGGSLDLLGPSQDYASLSNFSKVVMSVGMIIGRLEIYPVIILLSRSTWRKV